MNVKILELEDYHIPQLWEIVKSYPAYFSDEVSIKTLNDFSVWFKKMNKGAITGFNNKELIGCSYLDDVSDGMASVNIIFKRNFSPLLKLELAKQGLKYFFHEYNFKMLYGVTRVTNFSCIKFMKKIGFVFTEVLKEHKTVNGKPTDYILGGLIREAI